MASGSFTGTTANKNITPIIEWSSVKSDATNTSTVTAKLYYKKSSASTTDTGGYWSGTIWIGGYSQNFSGKHIVLKPGGASVLVAEFTQTIKHQDDGNIDVTIEADGVISGTTLTWTDIRRDVTLDTILRPSAVSCSEANVESNPTITITPYSPSFTHTISYQFGDLKDTIVEKTSATSITSWTIPTVVYSVFPNSKSAYGLIICDTYSGDKLIGSKNCEIKVTTDAEKCKPYVYGTVEDTDERTIALTGSPDILVRGWSLAHCVMYDEAKNCSTIDTRRINNVSVSGDVLWGNVSTGVFDFYVKDRRGYENTYQVTKTLVPYVELTANVTAKRTDPTSGRATLKIEGNYFNDNFGAKDNTLKITYKIGDDPEEEATPTISDDNKYSCTVSLNRDYTKSFNIEVVVKDELQTLINPATLGKGIPVFDWGENDFNFNVPVTIQGVNILEKLAELESLIS